MVTSQAKASNLEFCAQIRSWHDVLPAAHPLDDRIPLEDGPYGSISFASTHCTSLSGREDYVRELMKHLPVTVVGSTCLAHAPRSLLDSNRQVRLCCMRRRFVIVLTVTVHMGRLRLSLTQRA